MSHTAQAGRSRRSTAGCPSEPVGSYTATGPLLARCAALCRMSPLVEVTSAGPAQYAKVGAITLRGLARPRRPHDDRCAIRRGAQHTIRCLSRPHVRAVRGAHRAGRSTRHQARRRARARRCRSRGGAERTGRPQAKRGKSAKAREREHQRDHGRYGRLGGQRGLSGRRGVASGERNGSGSPGGGVCFGSRGRMRGARTMPNASNMNATSPIATGDAPRTAASG